MAKLIVTCSSPLPRRRGGEVFAGAKEFALDHFKEDDLTQIIADPVLTVVVGEQITADNLAAFLGRVEDMGEQLAAGRALEEPKTVAEIGAAKASGKAKA